MAELIYGAIMSLDGYIADENGHFDWSEPDAEVHAFVNELQRPVGTYLYGRRLYEVMAAWEGLRDDATQPPVVREFADIWHDADKVVYSTTLDTASTRRTRVERTFDPAEVRRLKESAERDISVGGPTLAAHAIRAGLVDEYQLFVSPVIIGGGTSFLPDGIRIGLDLVDERRFSNGVVHLRYRTRA